MNFFTKIKKKAHVLFYRSTGINKKDKKGNAALHLALKRGSASDTKILIDRGAKLNIQNNDGYTPLHYAAFYRKTEALKALIEAGAELNIQNNDGDTPFHKAAFYSKTEPLKVLIEAGAELDVPNNYGKTPLRLAAANRNREAAKLLIACAFSKNPQAQKPSFLQETRYNKLSRHFEACAAEIEKMKTCDNLSKLKADHISLHKLFCASDTKKLSYLGERLDIKKCTEKIEEHRDQFPIYYGFLKEQLIKARNTELMRNKFSKTLQSQNLKFNNDEVDKIFSYLNRNDIVNHLARAYVPKHTSSPCKIDKTSRKRKLNRGIRGNIGGGLYRGN